LPRCRSLPVRATPTNLVARGGTGHTNDPYTFWLPGKMGEWLADPLRCVIHGAPRAEQPAEPPPTSEVPAIAAACPLADSPAVILEAPTPSARRTAPTLPAEPSPHAAILRWLDGLQGKR
jgi:hypothetical protein